MDKNVKAAPDRQQLKERLSDYEFSVMFESGTEPPGTSPLLAEHRDGVFHCAACDEPLFNADTKFESGTGWPSFWSAIPGQLVEKLDRSHGMFRTEYSCANCGAHQGHLFTDGPAPTGLRYCNNGVALRFEPGKQEG